MRTVDLPSVVRLTDKENWGFAARDLKRMIALEPRGCLVATLRRKPIGLTTSIAYGKDLGWIGNVVVSQKERGAGIGTGLVQKAVSHLLRMHVRRIGLNSYPENERMYERLGFEIGGGFAGLSMAHGAEDSARKTGNVPFSEILRLDRRAFSADRSRLLRRLRREFPKRWTWISKDSGVSGYSLVKQYRASSEIGPMICDEMSQQSVAMLLRSSIALTKRWPLEISVPEGSSIVIKAAESLGFRVERKGFMMSYERLDPVVIGSAVGALGFLDKG